MCLRLTKSLCILWRAAMAMIRSILRAMSFFGKWLAEVIRQPGLMLSLVAGPFFILLAFGAGVTDDEPEPRITIVRQSDSDESRTLASQVRDYLPVSNETTNLDQARESLRKGDSDAVVVLP